VVSIGEEGNDDPADSAALMLPTTIVPAKDLTSGY
jgi:hypothetical protein